jgi:hypothetical protein
MKSLRKFIEEVRWLVILSEAKDALFKVGTKSGFHLAARLGMTYCSALEPSERRHWCGVS